MSLLIAVAQAVLAVAPAPTTAGTVNYPPAYFEAAHPATAREMLDRIPGFVFDGGERVRGYEGAAGNVLVDGQRPAAKSDTLDSILRRIAASSVDHIEIIHAGATGVDMQGRNVLANVVLKKETNRKVQVSSFAAYQPSTGRLVGQGRFIASGSAGGRKWEYSLFAVKFIDTSAGDGDLVQTDGRGRQTLSGLSQSHALGEQYQATGSYEANLGAGRLRLNGLLSRSPYEVDSTRRIVLPGTALESEVLTNKDESSEMGVRYNLPINATSQVELVALRQAKTVAFADKVISTSGLEAFSQDSKSSENIFRAVWKAKPSPDFSWELGSEAAFNRLDNRLNYTINGQKIALPSANVVVTEDRYEGISKASWSPSGAEWSIEGVVRQEFSRIASRGDTNLSKSLSYTKPRLAAQWNYRPDGQLRLRYEREVGQLRFTDFVATAALKNGVVTAGNPDLEPEQAWVSELSSEQKIWGKGAVVVTARHYALSNAIDRAPVRTTTSIIDAPANIGRGAKDELEINATLPLDSLGVRGLQIQSNVTWRRSRVTDPTTHDRRRISDLPDKQWDLNLTWDIPSKRLNLAMQLGEESDASSYRFNQIERTKTGSILSMSARWMPKDNLLFQVAILNANRHSNTYLKDTFGSSRNNSQILYRDYRSEAGSRMINIGFRKTF